MTSDLSQKNCVSCEGGIQKLNAEQVVKMLEQHTPQWHPIESHTKIRRGFKFKNFKTALNFVNKVGEIAEAEKHHPDIELGWGYVNITIQTHAISGLHENDFILASKIDRVV